MSIPKPVLLAAPQPWADRALCAQVDIGDLFYPALGEPTKPAKNICAHCEVRSECLEYALDNGERFGVWGGLSERERRKAAAARKAEGRLA